MLNPVLRIAATLAFACLSINPGYANTYIAIEGSSVNLQEGLDSELNPVGLRLRLGTPLADNLDLEGHFGFGGDARESAYDEFWVSYGGFYLKGYAPIGFNSAFYALGGFSKVSLSQTVNNNSFSDSRYGFSYGAGFETKIGERTDLTADYMRYVNDEGVFEDITAVSFGLKYYF